MTMTGAWSAFSPDFSPEAKVVFEKTVGTLRGVEYTPLLVSQQVVAGMNYRFICNAKTVVPGAQSRLVIIGVFAPPSLEEAPHILYIKDLVEA